MLLGDKAIGETIKIKENGVDVNYIVVNQGLPSSMYDSSCDGTWLVREKIHSNRPFDGGDLNDYENSDINAWLNSEFLDTISSETRELIKTVKIPFKKGTGNSSNLVQSGADGLSCKAFLLSAREAGVTAASSGTPTFEDGSKLAFFSDNASRICNSENNYAVYWIFRTPSPKNSNGVYGADKDGSASGSTTKNPWGIRPVFIFPADLKVNDDGATSSNKAPTITSDKTGDLGTLEDGFTCNYSVSDEDETDNLIVSLYIDDTEIDSFEAVKGQQYTYTLSGVEWLKITNGLHTFKIAVADGTDTVESTATFTRACDRLSTTMAAPMTVSNRIKACTLEVVGALPADAICLYEVTNNANDSSPVWEDCTENVKNGLSYAFNNKAAVNGFAFNFRVSIQRGASGKGGYITQVSGGFA